jgi:hypothetical protein
MFTCGSPGARSLTPAVALDWVPCVKPIRAHFSLFGPPELVSTGSELIVPVVAGDRVVGTLDVEDERTGAFGEGDRHLLERVAAEIVPLFE